MGRAVHTHRDNFCRLRCQLHSIHRSDRPRYVARSRPVCELALRDCGTRGVPALPRPRVS